MLLPAALISAGFDGYGNLGTINFQYVPVTLPQGIRCLSGKVCAPIHQSEQHPVHLQGPG